MMIAPSDPDLVEAIRNAVRAVEGRAAQRGHFEDDFERQRIVAEVAVDWFVDRVATDLVREHLPARHVLIHMARVAIDANSN